ncbi:MAG: hypothetical protein M2R45_01610 [Verrucomicrobia subdivision 3 bacterium]|nr:hypothetical protein [Limisphaerales bacterium]MCS1412762.1 hypothetical protein [Limisphaerales bacterium]
MVCVLTLLRGDFAGRHSHKEETVSISDANGKIVDRIDYKDRDPGL